MAATEVLKTTIRPREGREKWGLPGPRWVWLWALAIVGGVIMFLVQPGALTDDSYAFLDWGRDLLNHYLPLLEGRTFQPLPIFVGAFFALFGWSAPDATMIFTLATLVLSGCAAWRIVELLDVPHPAPALAFLLAMGVMPMPYIADIAYNNQPYATLILWAIAFDMEGKRGWTWGYLFLAGLTRPEAWPYLLCYGLWEWWRLGRPFSFRPILRILALALGPIVIWVGLEGLWLHDFLYSVHTTSGPAVANTHSNTLHGILRTFDKEIAKTMAGFALVGGVWLLFKRPRERPLLVVATIVLTAVGLGILARSAFNLPARDFSVINSLIVICAALGTGLPGYFMRRNGARPLWVFLVGLLLAGVVVAASWRHTTERVVPTLESVSFGRTTEQRFNHDLAKLRKLVITSHAHAHTVAMLGAVDNSELSWVMDVPFNVILNRQDLQTKVLVQPTELTYKELLGEGITNRKRVLIPPGWKPLVRTKYWEAWAAPVPVPVKLTPIPPPGA